MINGLLIEGVDYAGKTTLAENIEKHLKSEQVNAKYQKYYLTNNKITELLVEEGDAMGIGEKQDFMYTLATLVDIEKFTQKNGEFLIQDRHWLSIVAHNKFFYPDSMIAKMSLLESQHTPFMYNVYLTSDLKEKQRRIAKCPPTSPFDEYLAQNPEIHQIYDKFWIKHIPKDENWLVLDTTEKSPDEVRQAVVYFMKSSKKSNVDTNLFLRQYVQ